MKHLKSKMAFSFILIASGIAFFAMATYLAHMMFNWDFQTKLPQYCLTVINQSSKWHVSIGSVLFLLIGLTILLLLWKIGKQIFWSTKFQKRLRLMELPSLSQAINDRYQKETIVVIRGTKPLAFTSGFLKPRIVLSTELLELLDEDELYAVILHEENHQRHRDPLKMFLVSMLSEILWYLPVLKSWKRDYQIMRELMADQAAIETMESKLALSSALLKLIKSGLDEHPASTVPFADQTVNYRLKRLLDDHASVPMVPKRNVAVLSIAVLFLLMATVLGGCA